MAMIVCGHDRGCIVDRSALLADAAWRTSSAVCMLQQICGRDRGCMLAIVLSCACLQKVGGHDRGCIAGYSALLAAVCMLLKVSGHDRGCIADYSALLARVARRLSSANPSQWPCLSVAEIVAELPKIALSSCVWLGGVPVLCSCFKSEWPWSWLYSRDQDAEVPVGVKTPTRPLV